MFPQMPGYWGPQVCYNIFGGSTSTSKSSSTTNSETEQEQSGEFEQSGQQQALTTSLGDQAVGSYTANFLPDFMEELSRENSALLRAITLRPYEPYTGTRVAGFNDDHQLAFDLARGNVGAWSPYFDTAASTMTDVAGRTPTRWPDVDVDSYMNPYTKQVIDRSLFEANRQADIDRNAIKGRLAASDAYGGSAHGIELAEHNRNVSDLKQNLVASLLDRGFTDAAARFQFDESNLNAANALRLNSAQGLNNLGVAASQLGFSDAAAILDIATQQQALEQQKLDVAYDDFLRQFAYPLEMMQFRLAGAQAIPYATSSYSETIGRNTGNQATNAFNINRGTDSSQSSSTTNAFQTGKNTTTGPSTAIGDIASLAGGIGQLATGFGFSSRKFKEDIGSPDRILDRVLRLPIHSWRYKPEMGLDTEMHVGPMAEDWHAEFGLGDGTTINFLDGIGISLEAIKQMMERVEALEAA